MTAEETKNMLLEFVEKTSKKEMDTWNEFYNLPDGDFHKQFAENRHTMAMGEENMAEEIARKYGISENEIMAAAKKGINESLKFVA